MLHLTLEFTDHVCTRLHPCDQPGFSLIDLREFEAVRVGLSLSTCAKGARTSYWPAVCASTSATSVAIFEPDTRDLARFLVENDFSGLCICATVARRSLPRQVASPHRDGGCLTRSTQGSTPHRSPSYSPALRPYSSSELPSSTSMHPSTTMSTWAKPVSVAHRLRRPAVDETGGMLAGRRRHEVGFVLVRTSPYFSWTRGPRAPHCARAGVGPGARFLEFDRRGPTPAARRGGSHGSHLPALRRPRRAQGDGGRACAWSLGAARSPGRCATFATTTAGLLALSDWLARLRLHPCRHGGHRRLLEAGLARAGRRPLRADPGQRRAREERARAARPTSTTRCGWPTCWPTG